MLTPDELRKVKEALLLAIERELADDLEYTVEEGDEQLLREALDLIDRELAKE